MHSRGEISIKIKIKCDTNNSHSKKDHYRVQIARNRYTYAFWAIRGYTAHHAQEKASWRRLVLRLRSPSYLRMAQKAKADLLSAIYRRYYPLLASTVPINRSNDPFFATEMVTKDCGNITNAGDAGNNTGHPFF